MREFPLTIITINYNNLNGLKATVQSVLEQNAPKNWAWVLIDGASSDGSKEYLSDMTSHFDYFISEPDLGIYDAMNKGLKQVKNGFVWFLNSGDRLHGKNAINDVLQAIDNYSEVDCFYSDTYFVDEAYNRIGLISDLKPQKFPLELTFESFRYGMNICHQSFIVKRTLAPLYNLKYRQAADINWILEILKNHPKCKQIQSVLSEFQTGGSSTQNARRAMKERYKILERHFGFIPNLLAHFWIVLRHFLFRRKY